MTDQKEIAETLDCVGLYCPQPLFMTKTAIESIEVGEILEVLADDPAADADLHAFTKRTGHEMVCFEKDDSGAVVESAYTDMVRYAFSEPGRVGPPEAPRVPEHDTTPGPGGTDSRPRSAARYVPVRGRTLEHLSETIEDAPDRVPEDDQDGDQPDRHKRQNERILGKALARILVPKTFEE